VNRALKKYLCFPRFDDWPARARWVPYSRLSEDQVRMASAIQVLVSLAQRGLLFRLRRCDRCRRWFEGPEKKKFHSIACRDRAFLESDRGIEWRRKYQQRYMAKMRKKAKKEEKEFFEREHALRSKAGEPKRRSHSMKGH
jgi:hypothetical protein